MYLQMTLYGFAVVDRVGNGGMPDEDTSRAACVGVSGSEGGGWIDRSIDHHPTTAESQCPKSGLQMCVVYIQNATEY